MRIVLNDKLTPYRPSDSDTSIDLDRYVHKSLKMQGIFLEASLPVEAENVSDGLIGVLAHAYSRHRPVRVAPHDLWFIVLTQLAKVIKENEERCRPLFTNSDKKIDISVPTDDVTKIDPLLLIQQLEHLVPADINAFFPPLSTADDSVKIAMAAAFADAVQVYYNYMTYLCGIPEVDVTGTFEDWANIMNCIAQLAALFASIGMKDVVDYLIRVGDVIVQIGRQVGDNEPDPEFWRGIFTSKNEGSGSQLRISGWITKLFFTQPKLPLIENFTGTYATFPYKNTETGRNFRAYHGAFARCVDSTGTVYSGYGRVISEIKE